MLLVVSSYKHTERWTRIPVWNLPIFQEAQYSCGIMWTLGFHASPHSLFLNYLTDYWASCLDHYSLSDRVQSHLTLGGNRFCSDSKGCSITCIKWLPWTSYNSTWELWGEREIHIVEMLHGFMPPIVIHTYWQWIMDYPITRYVVMDIFIVSGALVHQH